MKKLLIVCSLLLCSALLTRAQDIAPLLNELPSDTVFACGIKVAKLSRAPLFKKYLAESVAQNVKEQLGDKTASDDFAANITYFLLSSAEPSEKNCDIQMLLPQGSEIRKKLTQMKDAVPVKYGSLTASRLPNGAEYVFPSENRLLLSTASLQSFLNAKKGLPQNLRQTFTDSAAFATGFLIVKDTLRKDNPVLAGMERILFRLSFADKTESGFRLSVDISCLNADAAKQTMMSAQQVQLMIGILVNNTDPALAQEFNKTALLKVEGNTVKIQYLFSEQLIRKFSVLAQSGALKNMMQDDSDF